jgi:hypothetical protein
VLEQVAAEQGPITATGQTRYKRIVRQVATQVNALPVLDVEMVDLDTPPSEWGKDPPIDPGLNLLPEFGRCAPDVQQRR